MMDDELAKRTLFSGDTFGVGDIAVAPFVWNLTNMGLSWTRALTLSAGSSSSASARRIATW